MPTARPQQPTVLDRLIGYVAPRLALDRFRARVQFAAAEAYTGSNMFQRSMRSWQTSRGSADADLNPSLDQLRKNSRDLERNIPLATGAIAGVVTSVVGTGLALQCAIDAEVLGWDEATTDTWQQGVEREWRLWAESTDCDITRHSDFYGLQDLALRSTLINGDAIALLPFVRRPHSPYDLRVQLVEGDRLCNKNGAADTKTLSAGVELDAVGAPVAYHLMREHPGAALTSGAQWDVVPAFGRTTGRRNVLHLFVRRRIGQNRGQPYLAPVIELLKTLGEYTRGEVASALVAGMLTVFLTSEGGGINMGLPGLSDETGATSADEDIKLGHATVVELKPGEKTETTPPGRPNQNFDGFVLAVVRQIGMGLEIPYEVLVKHFTASYSAARAALVEAFKFYRSRRAWLVQSFCQPIYEAWLEEAVAEGRIDAPGFFDDPARRRAYCGTTWHGDAMPQVDPVKEVEAAKGRVALGVSDRARETMELTGGDWMTTHKQQARERRRRLEAGLDTPAPAPTGASQAAPMDAHPPKPDDGSDLETPPPPSGAHVAAAAEIVTAVTAGTMPRDAGLALIQTCFDYSAEEAEALMGTAGTERFRPSPAVPPAPRQMDVVFSGGRRATVTVPTEPARDA